MPLLRSWDDHFQSIVHVEPGFSTIIEKEQPELQSFVTHVQEFLDFFFFPEDVKRHITPSRVNLTAFINPDDPSIVEPMIEFDFSRTMNGDKLFELSQEFDEKFKLYIANHSNSIEEFKVWRNVQRIFRFDFKREKENTS